MNKFVSVLLLIVNLCVSVAFQYTGFNMAGLEFSNACDPVPTVGSSLTYFRQQGHNFFRIPFQWEKLQYAYGVPFNADYLAEIKMNVANVVASGGIALLDCHNYYHFDGVAMTAADATTFGTFWGQLAKEFPSQNVWYEIMNEPYDVTTEDLMVLHQAAINGIRAVGATNKIVLSGNGYDAMAFWTQNCWYGTCNTILAGITDSLNNFIFEMHIYFDANNSGTHSVCSALDMTAVAAATAWLKSIGRQAVMTEFGIPNNANCVNNYAKVLLDYLNNSGEWLGYTVWGAGNCFSKADILSLDPNSGVKASDARIQLLESYHSTISIPAPTASPTFHVPTKSPVVQPVLTKPAIIGVSVGAFVFAAALGINCMNRYYRKQTP